MNHQYFKEDSRFGMLVMIYHVLQPLKKHWTYKPEENYQYKIIFETAVGLEN